MGRHEFRCPECKNEFETLRLEGNICPKCQYPKPEWQPGAMIGSIVSFKPFWHPNLDHTPVYIDSAKQLDKECDKRGLYIGSEKKGRKTSMRLPETEREARNV